ncbi:MAG: thioredoxin domain-containing protein [Alphaproteobacteria bacterium]
MSSNRLSAETSPYLLQHAANPVHWQPWDAAALADAEASGRPILLSVGYAACHWCHVMAHESFEDPAIAELMNAHFVNIKVDREERPDLDAIYQRALAHLGQQGGWPLTMFLTPGREPFWGGTYFPPTGRWGRPGFADVLRGVADTYAREPDKVRQNVTALRTALAQMAGTAAAAGEAGEIKPEIRSEIRDRIATHLAGQFDPVDGGMQGAPKFPQPQALALLVQAHHRHGHPASSQYGDLAWLTLRRMCQGGIYDHLGGGFARYSVDERWLVPHFEKMLYDNAQLLSALATAWTATRDPLFAQRAAETVDWLQREMLAPAEPGVPGQAFAATLDADSEGEEGKYYVWSEAEIDQLLGPDAALFKQAYGVTAEGNFEGRTILNRLHAPALQAAAVEEALRRARDVLFRERDAVRVRPGRDDKILTDWNGLMIAALAGAAMTFDRPDWLRLARGAYAHVRAALAADGGGGGGGGRLMHSRRKGQNRHVATLDDYAQMIAAALALHQAQGDADSLADAQAWLATLDAHYGTADGAGYFFTADDVDDVIVRRREAYDDATPSGNAIMVENLARLWLLTGDGAHAEKADAIVRGFAAGLERRYFSLCGLINAAALLQAGQVVVVVGAPGSDDFAALQRAAWTAFAPLRTVQPVAAGAALPEGHPAAGKAMAGGRATAYVCAAMTCSPPVTDAQELAAILARPPLAAAD